MFPHRSSFIELLWWAIELHCQPPDWGFTDSALCKLSGAEQGQMVSITSCVVTSPGHMWVAPDCSESVQHEHLVYCFNQATDFVRARKLINHADLELAVTLHLLILHLLAGCTSSMLHTALQRHGTEQAATCPADICCKQHPNLSGMDQAAIQSRRACVQHPSWGPVDRDIQH